MHAEPQNQAVVTSSPTQLRRGSGDGLANLGLGSSSGRNTKGKGRSSDEVDAPKQGEAGSEKKSAPERSPSMKVAGRKRSAPDAELSPGSEVHGLSSRASASAGGPASNEHGQGRGQGQNNAMNYKMQRTGVSSRRVSAGGQGSGPASSTSPSDASPNIAEQHSPTTRGAMEILLASPPSPSPSLVAGHGTRGGFSAAQGSIARRTAGAENEERGSPKMAGSPGSAAGARASKPQPLTLQGSSKAQGSPSSSSSSSSRPQVSLSIMGMANHAAAPMSPIPDKPISSAGTFSTVDLALHQQGQGGQSAEVSGGTSLPREGTDAQKQQGPEGLKGVLHPMSLQGLHTDESPAFSPQQQHSDEQQQAAAAGDLSASSESSSAGAGAGTGDDTSLESSFSDTRAEPLSLTSTISRGLFHQCGTARRVKVYELQNENWFDHGTGYCAGVYDEKNDQALLVAKAEEYCQYLNIVPPGDGEGEADGAGSTEDDAASSQNAVIPGEAKQMKVSVASEEKGSPDDEVSQDLSNQYIIVVSAQFQPEEVLLCTRVSRDDIYQRQQDTLIVWTEPGGKDMALSFQEGDGCNEIWEFLAEVQKHFRNTASGESIVSAKMAHVACLLMLSIPIRSRVIISRRGSIAATGLGRLIPNWRGVTEHYGGRLDAAGAHAGQHRPDQHGCAGSCAADPAIQRTIRRMAAQDELHEVAH